MATATRTPLVELSEFTESVYGVPRLHTRILVSTFLPTRYPPLWILVDSEKCRFLHDLEWGLTRLEHAGMVDAYDLRVRAHYANKWIDMLLKRRDRAQLIANRYWEWPGPLLTIRSRYPLVAAECLRLRLEFDAAKQPGERAREELYALVRRTLAEAAVDRGGIVPVPLDEVFHRRAQLLPLIDRHLTSKTALMRNFGFVAANHAAFCGRAKPDFRDFTVQRYMLRMAVPMYTEKMIRVLLDWGTRQMKLKRALGWKEIVRETGQVAIWQRYYGGLNTRRPQEIGKRLMNDLWTTGLVDQTPYKAYSLKLAFVDDLGHILEARE